MIFGHLNLKHFCPFFALLICLFYIPSTFLVAQENTINDESQKENQIASNLKSNSDLPQIDDFSSITTTSTDQPTETADENISNEQLPLSNNNPTKNEYIRKQLDIIVPDNDLIEKHRQNILSNFGKEWLYKIMNQGSLYFGYIIEEMNNNDMPECIAYLPVIESSYITTAVSKSGAVGLWQFMENSIHPFLIKNHWVDERLDPWLSTEAAIQKLKDNYKALGDWYLALAAYNCGLGAMKRALAKAEVKDFWYLAEKKLIPEQTIQYVPRFLAVADIITNAEYYDVTLPEANSTEHPEFTKLTINKAIDIPILSEKSGIETDVFTFLNPALKYNMTPPVKEYFIRVPADYADIIASTIEELDPTMYSGQYKVKQGDTLWGISRKFGITVDELCLINKIKEKAILRIGTVLNVPILN